MPVQTSYSGSMPAGFPGMLADALNDGRNIHPMFSTEASAMIPYGHAVEQDPKSGDGYDGYREANQGAKLPNANTDKIYGLLAHSHSTVDNIETAGLNGLKPGASLNILRRGRMYVKPEASSGVVPGARLHVRAVAAGLEVLGALRGSADSTDTIDCTNQGVWLTAPDANGIAEIEVDFVSKGGI